MGLVPTLVSFLGMDNQPQLQFESAWVCWNHRITFWLISQLRPSLTSPLVTLLKRRWSSIRFVMRMASVSFDHHQGAVPIFVRLINNGDTDVREQAVSCLAPFVFFPRRCIFFPITASHINGLPIFVLILIQPLCVDLGYWKHSWRLHTEPRLRHPCWVGCRNHPRFRR